MYNSNATQFTQQSQSVIDVIGHLRGIHKSLKRTFSNTLNLIIFILALIPIRITLYIYYLKLRRAFSSNNNTLSFDNYKRQRQDYIQISKLIDELNDIIPTNIPLEKIPFLVRGAFSMVIKIYNLISSYRDILKQKLDDMDSNAPSTDLLNSVSEQQLWNSRTLVYEYRF